MKIKSDRVFRATALLLPALAVAGGGAAILSQSDARAKRVPPPAVAAAPVPDVQPQAVTASALRAAASDAGIAAFYEANGWQPIWTERAAEALDAALAERGRHALDHVRFLEGGQGGDAAQAEVVRTRAALRYARALAQGVVDPNDHYALYTIARPDPALDQPLVQAVSQERLKDWLAGLAPQDEEYGRLSQAYLDFSQEAQRNDSQEIADTGLIHVGDSDTRVPKIVQALRQGGYLTSDAVDAPAASGTEAGAGDTEQPAENRYTQRIADALEALQRDYGIAEDGVVGPKTLEVLNLDPADRARELAVALERMRWLSRTPPATRIDVNTAAARLRYYRDGEVVDSRKVIVGEPGKETPQLESPFYRLVANPTWTVPRSIQREELAGLSAAQLNARNMEWRNGWIVERAGPENALGEVKFDMQNDHAIYLHDTGSPQLFERSERHLSHGCVRVDDALGFARMIAEHEGIEQEWSQARDEGPQQFVRLPREIPVRLMYRNVFVDDAGEIAFRTDPYGWNAPIADALGFAGGTRTTSRAQSEDVGP